MIIVLDENLPRHAASMLEAFDRRHEIRSVLDYFDPGTKDIEIFARLSEMKGNVALLTQDKRIRRNAEERKALREAEIHFVLLATTWSSYSWADKAWRLVKVWPSLTAELERAIAPSVFEISSGTSLKVQRQGLTKDQ